VPRPFESVEELMQAVGRHQGFGEWMEIDQHRIDQFADATGDHQWIHVDVQRAASGPYGRTIAHGYLTLSLLPSLVSQIIRYEGWSRLVNYGSEKVRFLAPVPVGSRVRAGLEILAVREGASGTQVTNRVTVEIDGVERPAVVAETITLLIR
jgi:acyl dehydratase